MARLVLFHSRADAAMKKQLTRYLALARADVIPVEAESLPPGPAGATRVEQALGDADFVLFLVSIDLVDSESMKSPEVAAAFRDGAARGARLVPIHLGEPKLAEALPWLATRMGLPRNGRSLASLPPDQLDRELFSIGSELAR